MKKASKSVAWEVEWYRTVAKAFRAVKRDAQAIAQGAKDLPPDGMFATDSQLEAELDRLSPDSSAPLVAELARVVDTLRGLAWWKERIDDWAPATPQGQVLIGLVANALDGLEGMRGEDARRLRRVRVDLICRIVGSKLAAASAEQAVEAEHRAERLVTAKETAEKVRKAREKGTRDKLVRELKETRAEVKEGTIAAKNAEREAKATREEVKRRNKTEGGDADLVATFRDAEEAFKQEGGDVKEILDGKGGVLPTARLPVAKGGKGRNLGNMGPWQFKKLYDGWIVLGKPNAAQYTEIHAKLGRRPSKKEAETYVKGRGKTT